MNGDLVIIRAFGNKAYIRKVWESNEHAVFITDDENFNLLSSGKEALQPVGFPKEDVFKFDQEIAKNIQINNFDWSKLKPWIE